MFPHEARLRNLVYSAPLYVDVELNQYRVNKEVNISGSVGRFGRAHCDGECEKESFGIRAHHVAVPLCVLTRTMRI
jgi:hypothetical protein